MGALFLLLLYKYVFFGAKTFSISLFFFKPFSSYCGIFSHENFQPFSGSHRRIFLTNLGQRGVQPITILPGVYAIINRLQG